MIAAQHQRHQTAVLARHHQGLHYVLGRDVETSRDLGDGVGLGGRYARHDLARRWARLARRGRRHHFDVGGVIAVRAERNQVFAGVSEDMEFMGFRAADIAGVGQHRAESQARARENAAIGAVHVLVGFFQRGRVEVKGIGVLHEEFAGPHDAETRSDLVAEFALDLVEIGRQLLVGVDLAADQVGDDFFVGGPQTEGAIVAILQAQQLWAIVLPAPRFLPQLGR